MDWIDTLFTFHVFGTIASDKNLHMNANLRKSIMTMFNTLIDSFDTQRWTGDESKAKDGHDNHKSNKKDEILVLGGGSNILFTKSYDGLIINLKNKGNLGIK